jgi:hypothetical protein
VEEEANKLHYYLRGICPRIDILFLQKHKLKGNITKKVVNYYGMKLVGGWLKQRRVTHLIFEIGPS